MSCSFVFAFVEKNMIALDKQGKDKRPDKHIAKSRQEQCGNHSANAPNKHCPCEKIHKGLFLHKPIRSIRHYGKCENYKPDNQYVCILRTYCEQLMLKEPVNARFKGKSC